jgi:mannose-6-phosphate isomerase-like protein (cupin superfamily)
VVVVPVVVVVVVVPVVPYGRVDGDRRARTVWIPGRVRTEIHPGGEDTDGAFCLLIEHPPAGWSLPAHLHRGVAETIHILAGEFEMTVDGRQLRLTAGETLHVPADVVHAGGNVGPTRGRRVVIFTPAGMENFFLQIGASKDIQVDPTAALATAIRHGWRFISQERGAAP